LWKFYVRIRAIDKAGNVGEHIWGQKSTDRNSEPVEILVDLEKPAATIDRVRGGTNSTPTPEPKSPDND
jgi:hypothetical protein